MKTIQILAISLTLLANFACSKKDSTDAVDQTTQPAAAVQEKPVKMLPNEIAANDLSGLDVEQDSSGKKVLYWEDPMVPDHHFNKSGKSPFMDMQLSPKYAQ